MRSLGIQQVGLLGGVTFALALGGCNSFEPKQTGDVEQQGHLVIPVDERAAVTAAMPMRPITGGTLTVLANGSAAIAADPQRDQVSIVDLGNLTVRATIALEAGDEPGRSVEDADQRVHVALRGGGAVVTIDPTAGVIVERRAVCKAPRGLAFDANTKLLHVACSEGKLVSLPAAGGAAVRTLDLEPDLRDVVVRGAELWVSTFKSAELLRVSASDGTLNNRVTIPQGRSQLTQPLGRPLSDGPLEEGVTLTSANGDEATVSKPVVVDPGIAWRTTASPGGGAVVVHQDAVADEIAVSPPTTSGSAYGGSGDGFGFGCDGIVNNVVTMVAPDGTVKSSRIAGAPLPVDVAISPDQQWIAVAHAGPPDPNAPRPSVEFPQDEFGGGSVPMGGPAFGFGGGSTLAIHSTVNLTPENPCAFPSLNPTQETVTAVSFTSLGKLVAQVQQPPALLVFDDVQFGGAARSVPLPGQELVDTGHELFHRDSGGGIACASCHPEGGEDGHTWRFADVGARRTQPLNVGLEGTAPFHWAGDLPNVGALMTEVFVMRMGGVRQSAERLDRLTNFLFSIEAPLAMREQGDAAALRGKELFDSAEVGCATCHSGSKLTNNQTLAIDKLGKQKLQVPSLVGIAYRAPFMHTGCAATLLDRFDPACGGDAHGNTAQLGQAELGDLVAYLESL